MTDKLPVMNSADVKEFLILHRDNDIKVRVGGDQMVDIANISYDQKVKAFVIELAL